MNFVKQYLAFRDYRRINRLPHKEELLWLRIFEQANDLLWIEWFGCDNQRLSAELGVTEKTLIDLRNKLKQKRLIDFIQGKKGKPTKYKLICLYENTVATTVETTVNTTVETTGQTTVETTDIYKHKLKLNNDNIGGSIDFNLIKEIENKHRILSPTEMQFIFDWQEVFTDDIILKCIDKAVDKGAFTIHYMRVILSKWQQNAVKTLDDIDKLDEIWNKNKGGKQRGSTLKLAEPIHGPSSAGPRKTSRARSSSTGT